MKKTVLLFFIIFIIGLAFSANFKFISKEKMQEYARNEANELITENACNSMMLVDNVLIHIRPVDVFSLFDYQINFNYFFKTQDDLNSLKHSFINFMQNKNDIYTGYLIIMSNMRADKCIFDIEKNFPELKKLYSLNRKPESDVVVFEEISDSKYFLVEYEKVLLCIPEGIKTKSIEELYSEKFEFMGHEFCFKNSIYSKGSFQNSRIIKKLLDIK